MNADNWQFGMHIIIVININVSYFQGLFWLSSCCFQADANSAAEELRKKRRFKKFTYRGVDLDQLLDMSNEQLIEMYTARLRRRFNRGLKRKHLGLLKRLRKAKKECPALEKPEVFY